MAPRQVWFDVTMTGFVQVSYDWSHWTF